MIKKGLDNVYIDIDDVIVNTSASVLSLANELFNKKIIYEELISFDLEKTLKLTPSEMKLFFNRLHDEIFLLENMPIEGAWGSLEKIKKMGYTIYLITGRPPETYEITKKWLKKNNFSYDFLYFADKYSRYKNISDKSYILSMKQLEDINFTLAVEDSLIMARWFSDRKTKVALLDCPWNRENTGSYVKRLYNWGDVMIYLSKL